jgi:peptidyl-tRNA hydrolase, PTH1 family
MIIFYGLGNNEPKYNQTKHNIGRLFVEYISKHYSFNTFTKQKSFHVSRVDVNNTSIICMYSDGYMNTSGTPLVEFLKYHPEDEHTQVIIVQDDSDQIEGKWKLAKAGGSAGHKGIDSIYRSILATHIKPSSIWRLKIGIRPEQNTLKSETFVLSRISKQDEETIDILGKVCINNLDYIINNDMDKAQTFINSKIAPKS